MIPGVLQSVQFTFVCALPNGLHARPASHLSEEAARFTSQFTLTNLRSGAGADLKSVLSIVAADIRSGDECRLAIDGADSEAAAESLRRFITEALPAHDEPVARSTTVASRALPRGLDGAGITPLFGIPASPGIGEGRIAWLGALSLAVDETAGAGPGIERENLATALDSLRARLQSVLSAERNHATAGIVKAHLAILNDAALSDEWERAIDQGLSAAAAVSQAGRHFAALLGRSESALVRERALDIQELSVALIENLQGAQPGSKSMTLPGPSVIVAETLAPHQLLALDRAQIQGLVLATASATSHAVILARSLGIPVIAGISDAVRSLPSDTDVIVDGDRGILYPQVTPAILAFYKREQNARLHREKVLGAFASAPAVTADGQAIEIAANIAHPDEVLPSLQRGADNIGLIRTEILFAACRALPAEDEQFELYAEAVRAANGKSVCIRTLDAGADKPIPALPLPPESNPFLGYRGIRIYPEFREFFDAQLRAALRASALGPVWIMAPMIANVEEARWFRDAVDAAKAHLTTRKVAFNQAPLGAMIEVPSAVFLIAELASVFDFFSIGANDLSQYVFAAGRENPRVSHLAAVRNPAFLRVLRQIAESARAARKWVGMCGEMAGDVRNLPLLVGLGLDELSVSSNHIAALKRRAAQLRQDECRKLLQQAAACAVTAEVEALLDRHASACVRRPLFDARAVVLHSSAFDKRCALSELIDTLFYAGRVDDSAALEEALWAREDVYSTGLGHGIAVPHCKSDAMSSNSIAILKLDRPIEWGSLDGAPVQMVILLALRASGENGLHMKVFSRLARKLMDETFRERLLNIDDPGTLVAHLGRELDGEI